MPLTTERAVVVEAASAVSIHAAAANDGREPDLTPADLIPEMRAQFRSGYGPR